MCSPAVGLAAAGLALGAVGTYSQQSQQRRNANAAAAVAERNAQLSRDLAVDARNRANAEEERVRRRQAQLEGRQRASVGASGAVVDVGSPGKLVDDTAGLAQLDIETVRNNAAREAWGFRTQSMSLLDQAAQARFLGRSARGATLLTGAGQAVSLASPLIGQGRTVTPSGSRDGPR